MQLFLLNIFINPKNYIDYEALEESKEALRKAKEFAPAKSKVKRKP